MKWISVPVEMTERMLKAHDPLHGGVCGPYGDDRYYLSEEELKAIWRILITAAQADNK